MKINFNVKSVKAWAAVIVAFISKPQSKPTKGDQIEKLLNENKKLKDEIKEDKEVSKK